MHEEMLLNQGVCIKKWNAYKIFEIFFIEIGRNKLTINDFSVKTNRHDDFIINMSEANQS